MARSNLHLKTLSLCLTVFSLMVAWSDAASAESTGGSWTYINPTGGLLKTFEGALAEPTLSGELEAGTHITLHSFILGFNLLEYLCKSFTITNGKLVGLFGRLQGKISLHGCDTLLNGVLSKACMPNAKGVHPELIETGEVKAVMLLHKLASGTIDKVLIAEPVEGTTFASVESTEACSIGSKVPIGGKFAIIDAEPTVHLVKHLFKEFPALTHLYVISDTAEHKATIAGSALTFLSGAHVGYKWAGLWN